MGQTGCFPYQLFHYIVLSLLVCICCCNSHLSLYHRFCKNCPRWLDSQWKTFTSSLLSLLCRMQNYCLLLLYGLPSWSQSPHPVTYVCILLGQEMLSLGLCFSIFTIFVQALPLGHVLTTIPSIQCVPMVISISASTPLITPGNNG
jgi:hypothetical protein